MVKDRRNLIPIVSSGSIDRRNKKVVGEELKWWEGRGINLSGKLIVGPPRDHIRPVPT